MDPQTARRLPLTDKKRIIRALEVYLETGETITEHDERTRKVPPKYAPLWFGLDFQDRQTLYDRINLRVERMMEKGLVEEVKELLSAGVPASATSMQAIGYKEIVGMLACGGSIEEAAAQIQQASRRYAKRQLTWFRRNPNMHWMIREKGDDLGLVAESVRQIVKENDKSHMVG